VNKLILFLSLQAKESLYNIGLMIVVLEYNYGFII